MKDGQQTEVIAEKNTPIECKVLNPNTIFGNLTVHILLRHNNSSLEYEIVVHFINHSSAGIREMLLP